MLKQTTFPVPRDAMKEKQTRRELFLTEMDAVAPWSRSLALNHAALSQDWGRVGARRCRWRQGAYFEQNPSALSATTVKRCGRLAGLSRATTASLTRLPPSTSGVGWSAIG
jgi:hypothetical protein